VRSVTPTAIQRLKSRCVNLVAGALSRNYYVTQVARRIVQLYDNDGNADMRVNGERLLLQTVIAMRPAGVLFDVGANRGDWSAEALSLGFRGRLVAVDPLSRNVVGLRQRFKGASNVEVAEFALSDVTGEAEFFSNTDESEGGTDSLFDMRRIGYNPSLTTVRVVCTTLASLAKELGVDRIDLLKIDVEGNELSVLKGAGAMLSQGSIDFIQLEFGHAARAAKVYLHDIVQLASSCSYEVFVIKPRGFMRLQFSPFSENRYAYVNLLLARGAIAHQIRDRILLR
jgi:FkbM family methyltransferase